MEQMSKTIYTCQRLLLKTNSNGTVAQDALNVNSQMTSQLQWGGANKKRYTRPKATMVLMDVSSIMAYSLNSNSNTTENRGTQDTQPGPETGSNEPHEGGDELVDAAKRWQWVDDPSY